MAPTPIMADPERNLQRLVSVAQLSVWNFVLLEMGVAYACK